MLQPLSFLRPMALPRPATLQRFLATAAASNAAAPVSAYRIARTASKNLPIYLLEKRGGNMKLTKVRKIEGDVSVLRAELQEALGLGEKEVVINQLTKQIIVKGHRKPEIIKFLEERNF
ncbi:mitochondrial large ribosomal subunit l49 [Phlyctema vagabunda]|uniref:Large ribosomal subunit protein mL49 n=1 Tax=Phlyctema vagabunda TaxID=108571 RepID=A0ABR4PST7_9HELO